MFHAPMEIRHSNAHFSHDNVRTTGHGITTSAMAIRKKNHKLLIFKKTVPFKVWHQLCREKFSRFVKQLPAPSPFGYNMGTILYPNSWVKKGGPYMPFLRIPWIALVLFSVKLDTLNITLPWLRRIGACCIRSMCLPIASFVISSCSNKNSCLCLCLMKKKHWIHIQSTYNEHVTHFMSSATAVNSFYLTICNRWYWNRHVKIKNPTYLCQAAATSIAKSSCMSLAIAREWFEASCFSATICFSISTIDICSSLIRSGSSNRRVTWSCPTGKNVDRMVRRNVRFILHRYTTFKSTSKQVQKVKLSCLLKCWHMLQHS